MNKLLKEVSTKLFDYLGLEEIEIRYEEIPDDSRFYNHELYIGINNKYLNNESETLKCLIHEIRHYYQLCVVAYQIELEPQYEEWKKEFKLEINKIKPEDSMCLYIEVDAYAFTKYILKEWFDIDYHHYDKNYDQLLDKFIKCYYMRL